MPKETTVPFLVLKGKIAVPSLSSNRSTASPYSSPAKTANKIMMRKLLRSVLLKKDKEEARCSICTEPPHNSLLLKCSNIEKGCHPYVCDTIYSNCLNQFRKTPASTPTLLCPQCGGEVANGVIFLEGIRDFMNSRPRRCPVETCEFTGNHQELVRHVRLDHRSASPQVVTPVHKLIGMGMKRREWGGNLMAIDSDSDSDVAANRELDAVTAQFDSAFR